MISSRRTCRINSQSRRRWMRVMEKLFLCTSKVLNLGVVARYLLLGIGGCNAMRWPVKIQLLNLNSYK